MKTKVPKSLLNDIYKTVIQPHIEHCLTVWGFDKVQHLQNRVARIVSGNYDWTILSTDIIKLLNWQTVPERRDYFTSLLMYRCIWQVQHLFRYGGLCPSSGV